MTETEAATELNLTDLMDTVQIELNMRLKLSGQTS